MAVSEKYNEILGFYRLEDGNDYSEHLLPYVRKLEAVVEAAKSVGLMLNLLQDAGPFRDAPSWTQDLLAALAALED